MTTIWNTADKSANITLSGSSLIATTTSATQGAVRATTSMSSGKIYVEYSLIVATGSTCGVGWANSTMSLAVAIGSTKDSVFIQTNNVSAGTFLNNVNLGNMGYLAGALVTVCQCFDITNKLFWTRFSTGFWNGSSTADPATGTGGFSTATLNAGPYFPIFSANGSGASLQANFGASDFNYAPPTGFTGIDTNLQNYAGSSKFLGYVIESPPQTAVSASKFLGYAVESPPQTAVSVSKLLGYAIIVGIPPNFTRARNLHYLRM